jgi:hypothetical protein
VVEEIGDFLLFTQAWAKHLNFKNVSALTTLRSPV